MNDIEPAIILFAWTCLSIALTVRLRLRAYRRVRKIADRFGVHVLGASRTPD